MRIALPGLRNILSLWGAASLPQAPNWNAVAGTNFSFPLRTFLPAGRALAG